MNLREEEVTNQLAAALSRSLGAKRLFRGKASIRINSDVRLPPGGGDARALMAEELANEWEIDKGDIHEV